MPIYEYHCPSCDHKFEFRRPMSEATAPASCPQCHSGARRTLSVFASISRGSSPALVPATGPACGSCAANNAGYCASPN